MHKIFASAFAIAALAAAAPAVAQDSDTVSISVETHDLDLNSHADRDTLDQRIDTAIRRACRPEGRDTEAMRDARICRSDLADAIAPPVEMAIAEAATVRLAAIDLDLGA